MSDISKAPAAFTAAELAAIRHAVEDHAGRFYGQVGPFTFGREQAARYTSEGPLSGLCDRYGLAAVWRAVAEVIEEHPQVLEHRYSDQERRQRQQERAAQAQRLADEAAVAFKADDQRRALELLDQAELADPTYRPGWRSFDELRSIVRSRTTTS